MKLMNNALWLTCGHKTFGVKWLFEHPATHQLLVSVDTNAARSPKRFIPPTVSNHRVGEKIPKCFHILEHFINFVLIKR